jgi:O-antigen biosynthesis alpha-1,3-rhamnosyltransferase
MPPPRVAYDMTPALLSPSGMGRYAREMERALSGRSDVELIRLAASRRRSSGAARRAAQGVSRELLYYPLLLGRRGTRDGADLLHCPSQLGPVRGRLPLVMTVHDLLPLRFPQLFTRVNASHMWLMAKAVLPRAERIITGSEFTRGEIAELVGVEGDRIEVIPYGVAAQFHPQEPDREWLRARFGLGGRYVVCVGTLEPRKNLVAALRAFRRLSSAHQDLQLAVVGGEGWRNEHFERELRDGARSVVSTGYVGDDELSALYAGAACLLFPSLSEGFGFPVLEAMACGVPVVSSNRTSLPEVVGDAGLLVDPEDEASLAAAVERILESSAVADELRTRGLRRAERFSWSTSADATVDVYRRVLA